MHLRSSHPQKDWRILQKVLNKIIHLKIKSEPMLFFNHEGKRSQITWSLMPNLSFNNHCRLIHSLIVVMIIGEATNWYNGYLQCCQFYMSGDLKFVYWNQNYYLQKGEITENVIWNMILLDHKLQEIMCPSLL